MNDVETVGPIVLPLDGERFIPGEMFGQIELEHRHRYTFATQFVIGKTVLDIACGEGYGSALMAQFAQTVTGVDIAEDAVAHAQRRYQADNLKFEIGSCSEIPLADGSVEVIVSFETIEHHTEHSAMMLEVRRVLRPGGLLIISSPDKLEYSDKPAYRNPFHVRELYKEEFETLLSNHFSNVKLLGQRVIRGSILWGEQSSKQLQLQQPEFGSTANFGTLDPMYWLAIASDNPLPPTGDSIFGQPAEEETAIADRLLVADGSSIQDRNPDATKMIRLIALPNSVFLTACLRSDWYLQQHPDLVEAGVDPVEHWYAYGSDEGRLPTRDMQPLVVNLLKERERALKEACSLEVQSDLQASMVLVRDEVAVASRDVYAQMRLQEEKLEALREGLQEQTRLFGDQTRELASAVLRQLEAKQEGLATELLRQRSELNSQLARITSENASRDLQLGRMLQSMQERSDRMVIEHRNFVRLHYSSLLMAVKKDLDTLRKSISWRLTAPIRAVAAALGSRSRLPEIPEMDFIVDPVDYLPETSAKDR